MRRDPKEAPLGLRADVPSSGSQLYWLGDKMEYFPVAATAVWSNFASPYRPLTPRARVERLVTALAVVW